LSRRRPTPSGGTDRALIALLALLNVGSLYTTVVGARQILPWPMSDVVGLTVQLMLFLTLAGWVGRFAPVRRWLVAIVFAGASVYTSFFAYYGQLAGASLASINLDKARQAHARFVDDTWEGQLAEVERLEQQAARKFDQAEREGSAGLTTGRVGFGPVAKQLAGEAAAAEVAASERRSDLERMRARFEIDAQALAADQLYLHDLQTWQTAPDTWKATISAPDRATYLDLDQEVALLTPFLKVRQGDLAALAALALALMVDGTCLFLGTAIHARRQPLFDATVDRAVGLIAGVRGARTAVTDAWTGPVGDGGSGAPPAGLAPLAQLVRVSGPGSAFVGTVYEAVHPTTRTIDAVRLFDHDDRSYRIAARVLLDRLHDPSIGWVRIEDGRWRVVRYDALVAWLSDQYRAARDLEADQLESLPESVVQLPVAG
ncbi:MAG: hypothetical protein ABMA64_39415, partial [Myxococcota bacterium]